MAVLETVVETLHIRIVQLVHVLLGLEQVIVVVNFLRISHERNKELDVASHRIVAQRLQLLGIIGTDDDVAVGSIGVSQYLVDIVLVGYVPCTDVGRDANGPQAVASHQYTTIVFQHALAIGTLVVQRQHHTHPDLSLAQVLVGLDGWLGSRTRGTSRTSWTNLVRI